ncbi:MAG: hypothetical protein M1409_09825 [Actinobacteria bacterium]|nr:hypothetical protein [Actinomycetota bacterium]
MIAISVTISALRNMKYNEHKIIATHYGEELSEWLNAQKENDWSYFISFASSTPGTKYCFDWLNAQNQSILCWPGTSGCPSVVGQNSFGNCNSFGLNPPIFKRQVTLISDATNTKVTANITVSWSDLNTSYAIPLTTEYDVQEQY